VPAIPRLAQFSPDTLVSGAAVVITGENLAHAVDSISLTVGGVVLQVRSASATRIDAMVPVGALPCAATATQPVTLTVAGTVLTATVPVRAANRLALKAGESANLLTADEVRCTELAAPTTGTARYMLAVVNTGSVASASSAFELRGTGIGAMAGQLSAMKNPQAFGSMVATTAPSSLINASLLPGMRTESLVAQPEAAAESQHDAQLNTQRTVAARAGSATTQWSVARAEQMNRLGVAMASSAASLNVGDVITMKAIYNSCNAGSNVQARVVYAGTRAVVLEDVAAPRARTMDADYRAIGDEFDRVQYPLLRDNIGDPLAMNGAMNGDGRVTMLFTRFVNDSVAGTAGYVSACNFYPKSTFAASNENEVFYARVATATETPAEWRRAMRSTVIHEGKHLASFAERLVSNTPFEESWLEESTARIAEELYSRTFTSGGSWKGNTGFATTVQ
jgi:IPT/TIG domain